MSPEDRGKRNPREKLATELQRIGFLVEVDLAGLSLLQSDDGR